MMEEADKGRLYSTFQAKGLPLWSSKEQRSYETAFNLSIVHDIIIFIHMYWILLRWSWEKSE